MSNDYLCTGCGASVPAAGHTCPPRTARYMRALRTIAETSADPVAAEAARKALSMEPADRSLPPDVEWTTTRPRSIRVIVEDADTRERIMVREQVGGIVQIDDGDGVTRIEVRSG